MKKILLSLVLFSLVIGVAIGQSLSLSNADGPISGNSVFTEYVEPGSGIYSTNVYVTNNGGTAISVKAKKIENYLEGDEEGGMEASICWAGQCFSPNVYVSPNGYLMEPGETNEEDFLGDLHRNDYVGISSVTYVFFDEDNPVDSVSVIVNYVVTAVAQASLVLSLDDVDLENNEVIIVNGTAEDESLTSMVNVTNNAETDISVKVRRIETNMPAGSSSYFTWLEQYANEVSVSPDGELMSPGGMNTSFSGDYQPNNVAGEASISYVFFDENDLSNFTTINVTYNAATVGIEENNFDNVYLSNAYPNPANTVVTLDYDLKDMNGAKLVVYDLLGSVVKNVEVNDAIGKLKINVSDLDEGVYFYSLLVKNENVTTQKLVVKH